MGVNFIKKNIFQCFVFLFLCFLCSCKKEAEYSQESPKISVEETSSAVEGKGTIAETETTAEQWEKGYYLPVPDQEWKEAEKDCITLMEQIFSIYERADKGTASNVVLSEETMSEMQQKLMETGCPVTMVTAYANMENFQTVDLFLKECGNGIQGSVVVYQIAGDGGIGRLKFLFDGVDMYLIGTRGTWNESHQPVAAYTSYTRIKEWNYTEKGWFCYELCVPEVPEVSESVDGSCLLRVKPMTEVQREFSQKCVYGIGYQGNNLLCSNWDGEHLEGLDFNALYEYLYAMKFKKKFNPEEYPDGIPKQAFEELMMEYLPVTAEQLQEYAAFDKEQQTYPWRKAESVNYTPTFFETSLPEVTSVRNNEDGTVTLTVEAVCEVVLCDDAVISHELTIRFEEDGSFRYLGNKILEDGLERIPEYRYRITDFDKEIKWTSTT